ncbi:MerR family transcriptional regulator [Paenibacillus sp. PSB04]|uniref:MerR family transcriptional regulator n=1 Tax=Paenibacillus sp. PSB04 TaxID=2866810 RepID=UPI0021F13EE9|nr:MerR family transcriptional regulator [Paenibacillus sp. PSB04]UYO05400.1 MerR family transcriptional regulator [Paenibacillus sp. PSB04]
MFKITEFSKISQVSAKALRYYDQIGLLKPSYTDPDTGYRFYTADQLKRVHRILVFKDLGFTLEQMIPLLDGALGTEPMRTMLLHKSAEIAEMLREEQARLNRIEARLDELDRSEDGEPPLDVVVRQTGPEWIASIREVTSKSRVPGLIRELRQAVKALYKGALDQRVIVLWHSCAECEDAVDLEVGVPVAGPLPDQGRIRVRELKGAKLACIAHSAGLAGSYEVTVKLAGWLEEQGYGISEQEPSREIYWELPDQPASPVLSELQMPIVDRPGGAPGAEGGQA